MKSILIAILIALILKGPEVVWQQKFDLETRSAELLLELRDGPRYISALDA